MATRFSVWIDTPIQSGASANTQTYSDYSSDLQRTNGFSVGNAASSIRVNTALREATLVSTALMECILPEGSTLDMNSSVNDVKTAIQNKFDTFASKNPFYVGSSAPTDTTIFWVDTGSIAGKSLLKYHNGTAWTEITSTYDAS